MSLQWSPPVFTLHTHALEKKLESPTVLKKNLSLHSLEKSLNLHCQTSRSLPKISQNARNISVYLLMVRNSKLSMGFPPFRIALFLFKERSLHNNDATQRCMEGCITCGNRPSNLNTTRLVRLFCEHQILK